MRWQFVPLQNASALCDHVALHICAESAEHKVDLVMLLHQTHWRKEGERPRSLDEALIEQDMIREEQRKEKERQAALAAKL